jgi:hypothetical protein
VPVPRRYKTDESFLEKIAIGATGTRFVLDHLAAAGHDPIELERGSTSFKIWKAIKIKRVRVPDILCLRCGRRVESRAKTKVEISMSHSTSTAERGWDHGLADDDLIAIVRCEKTGEGPLDWQAREPVQYIKVADMRAAWRANTVIQQRPKGAQEGFELRVVWPCRVATQDGVVERVAESGIAYRANVDRRTRTFRFTAGAGVASLVAQGDRVEVGRIVAAVVPVATDWTCGGGATIDTYVTLAGSSALADRYTAVKALGRFDKAASTDVLTARVADSNEHIYVRAEAAAGLMRRNNAIGRDFLATTLIDEYLENRLEAAIILGEVATTQAVALLVGTLQDKDQHPEVRAGAAWSLGEIGRSDALPVLIASFTALETTIKIEAARAIAKLARGSLGDVLAAFPPSSGEERPGIAWALSMAGGFNVSQVLPMMIDDDARRWVAYMVGTQEEGRMVPEIEKLKASDPEVYFAVTVLWKIIASWVYELEEY